SEIHTAQAIGKKYVVFIQNGKPAKLRVANMITGAIEKEFELPVGNPDNVHPQFRHARLTDAGTIMVAHKDMGKVAEYDVNGKQVWSVAAESPWSAVPLDNGNVLISGGGNKTVTEVNRKGETVWQYSPADLPAEYTFADVQVSLRLSNGNTIINNWDSRQWQGKRNTTVVQAIEVGPDKKIVWTLRAWTVPDSLGRSTIIQPLDVFIKKRRFGEFK
ncbi:MAG: PQQ-binding-like beta-propeller repeat protein, partial [Mucilaginibacter sp.]